MASAYANALVEVAQSTNSLEAVHSDVDALAQLLKDNEARWGWLPRGGGHGHGGRQHRPSSRPACLLQSIKDILTNPVIADDKKKDLVSRIASEAGFSPYTTNFLKLLLDQRRMEVRAHRAGRTQLLLLLLGEH